jgi:cbb3-type cytochrome oxidase maturation protein
MNVLAILIPIALALGGCGLAAFLWSLGSGQFDDLEGAGWRAIADDDLPEAPAKMIASDQCSEDVSFVSQRVGRPYQAE